MRCWLYLHSLSFPLAMEALKALDLYLATTHRFLVRIVLLALFLKDSNCFDHKITTFSCFGTGGSGCKESAWTKFSPWVRKIPWRRAWQPTPVFLPGESHGQRSLAGYSSWGHRVGHNWVANSNCGWQIWQPSFHCKEWIRISSGLTRCLAFLKKNTWIYLIFYTPTYTYIGICVCILAL